MLNNFLYTSHTIIHNMFSTVFICTSFVISEIYIDYVDSETRNILILYNFFSRCQRSKHPMVNVLQKVMPLLITVSFLFIEK